MKAGIVVDNWKLKIFDKVLTDAGYKYEKFDGPGPNISTLTVQTDDLLKMQTVVKEANDKARRSKMQ